MRSTSGSGRVEGGDRLVRETGVVALEESVDLVELAVAVLEDVEGRLAAFLVGGVCSRVTLWVAFFRADSSWRGGRCGWIGAWWTVGFVAVLFRGRVGV